MTEVTKSDRLQAELDLVKDLNDLFEAYTETYPELEQTLSTVFINFSLRSMLFASDPLIMSETVSASLAAWMTFSRKLSEQQDAEDMEPQRIQVLSRTDEDVSPELLFMDTFDVKPN
jgi:hypothetical protein